MKKKGKRAKAFKPLLVRFNKQERKILKTYGRFHKMTEADVLRSLIADLKADLMSSV